MRRAIIIVTVAVIFADGLWSFLGRDAIPAQFQFNAWVVGVFIVAAISEP